MNMNPLSAWSLGLLIVLLSVFLGELSIAFNDYIFHRLGISRNLLLSCFWLLFSIASFVAAYCSGKFKVLVGLSFIFIVPLMAVIAHYINEIIGTPIDIKGAQGAVVVFKIYFIVSIFLVSLGTFFGIFLSKRRNLESV